MITIPHNFTPRKYQAGLYNSIGNGYKRAVAVWHRRAGKDKTLLNLLVKEAHKRVGVYYYFFPTYNQGRKVLWDGIDRNGFRYMDHIPEELRENTNQQEMKVRLKCGSMIQIVGTDNIDAIMGTNPVGCVFSEYSLQSPAAWDLIRPILAENGGWAVFNYTPRGRNHGFELYEMARNNKDWYCEILTIEDTGAVPVSTIQEEREAGMSEEMIEQEFYCSFNASLAKCFFTGALDGHHAVARGIIGSLTKTKDSKDEFEYTEDRRGNCELWRFPYQKTANWDGRFWTNRYCIGSDISEGLGGDYSVAYVYDRNLKEFVFCQSSNKIDSYIWGDKLHSLSSYYGNALIVPERNGAGITTINRLIELKANLYVKEIVAGIGKQTAKQYGWLETKESKQSICGTLKSHLMKKNSKIHDNALLQECASFVKDEDREKLGADTGFHDDRVIAAALALQGDLYLPKPEQLKEPVTGWRKRLEEDREGSVWAA